MNIKKIIPLLKNTALVVFGTILLSFGTAVFILPFDLTIGGTSTIAIVLNKIIKVEFITTELLITILTWFLFILGYIFLGKNFALQTLISTILYPVGVTVFAKLTEPDFFEGFFSLANSNYSEIAIILGAIFGGGIIGAGLAFAFMGGGSTGGTDVIAFLLCKIFKKLKSSVAVFLVDAITILSGMFIIKDLSVTLLGITSCFIGAIVIDKLFLGESEAFIAQVVSKEYESINKAVAEKLERTTSIIEIKGGYSGETKQMLLITFSIKQYKELIKMIYSYDKNAFITIHRAHEISGEGWSY